MSDPATRATAATERDTSWPLAADFSEVCTCGHPRSSHAYPGPAGTVCGRCPCSTFGVLR